MYFTYYSLNSIWTKYVLWRIWEKKRVASLKEIEFLEPKLLKEIKINQCISKHHSLNRLCNWGNWKRKLKFLRFWKWELCIFFPTCFCGIFSNMFAWYMHAGQIPYCWSVARLTMKQCGVLTINANLEKYIWKKLLIFFRSK